MMCRNLFKKKNGLPAAVVPLRFARAIDDVLHAHTLADVIIDGYLTLQQGRRPIRKKNENEV